MTLINGISFIRTDNPQIDAKIYAKAKGISENEALKELESASNPTDISKIAKSADKTEITTDSADKDAVIEALTDLYLDNGANNTKMLNLINCIIQALTSKKSE